MPALQKFTAVFDPKRFGHESPDNLAKIDPKQNPQNKQAAAYHVADLLSKLTPDPKFPGSAPTPTIVGGYSISPKSSKGDIDIEVANVSWEHLQAELFKHKDKFEYFRRTRADERGVIAQDKTKAVVDGDIGGNVYVCVWLKLNGGHVANISIPMQTGPQTDRYDLKTVSYQPQFSFKQASERRTFAHKAVGYDILKGQFVDPHEGLSALERGTFKILNKQSSANDPLDFYTCVIEMLNNKMTPDAESNKLLRYMAAKPINISNASNVSIPRLVVERAKLINLTCPPSVALRFSDGFGVFARDIPELDVLKIGSLRDLVGPHGIYEQMDQAWTSAKLLPGTPTDNDRLVLIVGSIATKLAQINSWDVNGDASNLAQFIHRFIHPDQRGGTKLIQDCIESVRRRLA